MAMEMAMLFRNRFSVSQVELELPGVASGGA